MSNTLMLTEDELDNMLVQQKNQILLLISRTKLKEARACLKVLKPLWCNLDYSYKYEELTDRINQIQQRRTQRLSKKDLEAAFQRPPTDPNNPLFIPQT